jgi:outer membrane protein TolC
LLQDVNAQDTTAFQLPVLEQLWMKAEAHNKQLQAKQRSLSGSKEALASAIDERLPDLQVNGEYARISNMPIYENGIFRTPAQFPVLHQSYALSAEAYLNIYNGGKTKREIQSKEVERDIMEEQVHLTHTEIRYQVALAYLDLFRNQQYRELVLQDIKERQKQLQEIKNFFSNGTVLKSDVLRAELNLSKQETLLLHINNNIILANQQINLLTGDPEDNVTIPDTTIINFEVSIPQTYEEYVLAAYQNSFDYKIVKMETSLSALHLQEVKSAVLPKAGLFAEYKYADPQILLYPYAAALYGFGMAGVRASMPLSELYRNKHKKQGAAMDLQAHQIQDEDLKDKIRQQVSEAYIRYNEAIKRIGVARKNIQQATETYRITRNTYFSQTALLTDLLDAETQLLQAKMDHTTELVNARLLYYRLQKITGKL